MMFPYFLGMMMLPYFLGMHDDVPLLPGHDDAPLLPGYDDAPLLPGHDDAPLLPGQTNSYSTICGNSSKALQVSFDHTHFPSSSYTSTHTHSKVLTMMTYSLLICTGSSYSASTPNLTYGSKASLPFVFWELI